MEREVIGRWEGAVSVLLPTLVIGCSSQSRIDLVPVPAGVVVEAQLQYYDVSAASLSELRRMMAQLGPRWEGRSYQAVTESRFQWAFLTDHTGPQLCEPSRVRVTVATTMTFPRWNPSAEPDSATLEWWHQLNAGLMEHERGHAQLSVKTAGSIARTLEDMSAVPCDELRLRVSNAGQRHIELERREQIEYDRVTRHGATQIERASRLRSP